MKIEIEGTVPQVKTMTLGEVKAAGTGVFVRMYNGVPSDDTGIVKSAGKNNALNFFCGSVGEYPALDSLTWAPSATFVRLLDGEVTVHSNGSVTLTGSQYEMEPAVAPKVYTVDEARREPGVYQEDGRPHTAAISDGHYLTYVNTDQERVEPVTGYGRFNGLHKLENAKVTITG